jgi:hypothetical protein
MPRNFSGQARRGRSLNLFSTSTTIILAIATLGSFAGFTLIPSKPLLSCEAARPILTCESDKITLDKTAPPPGTPEMAGLSDPASNSTKSLGQTPQVSSPGPVFENPGGANPTTSFVPPVPTFDKRVVARDPLEGPRPPEKQTVAALPPALTPPEYTTLTSGSMWQFGDSLMRLERDDAVITVYYERPRPGLLAVGVKPGFLFLKAKVKHDGSFSGEAYRFSKLCPNPRYQVTGKVDSRSGTIRMTGRVSSVNENCEIIIEEKITDFEFRLLDDAGIASFKKAA